jgi:hypothetical protein
VSAPPSATATPSRPRRWRRRLGALALLLAGLSLLATWVLQPQRLATIVLDRAGQALDLEITAAPDAEARLRDRPQLLIHDLVVRRPGTQQVMLRAKRLLIAMPWSTLRGAGKDVVVERIELDAPALNLPALQAWLATRPPSAETKIPTLTDGLRIVDGRIDNDDWRIDGIAVDLPDLAPDRPVRARLRGRYLDAPPGSEPGTTTTRIPFDLAVALTRPANDAGAAVSGELSIERGDWRLPTTLTLSGPLHLGQDDVAMTPAKLEMSVRYESGDTRLPFALALQGPLRFDEATWVLAPAGVALRGESPLPDFDAQGALAVGRRLVISLDGTLPAWPDAWPALPAPVSSSQSTLPFTLRYTGRPDLSDVAGLSLRRDSTTFDARFRLYDVLGWIERSSGAPLPPLDGRLSSPTLEISGATLEGVEIELDDETVPTP